jgi:hypothetical protein
LIQAFQVEGLVPKGQTSHAPGGAVIGALENVQNLFSGRQAGLSGPPAPYLPLDSEGDELLSLISVGRPETESTPSIPKSPRAKPQNFGKTPREKRKLLDAAHKNLEMNEVDLPIPPARANTLRDRLGKEYQTRQRRIEDEKRQGRRTKAGNTGAGRRGVSPEESQIIAADDLYGVVRSHFNRVQLLPRLQVRVEAHFPRKRACLLVEALDKVMLVG